MTPTQTLTTPFVEHRKPGARPEGAGWNGFLLVVTALLVAGFFQAHPPEFTGLLGKNLYKPGDKLGYNLGLAGGLMMLIMLLYSLRKRAGFMKGRGILPTWFRWHMVFGIMGPTLIMFHSTFNMHSINAGVALVCTMLVSGSGIFGRFFYTKIHNGLYGRQITLKGMHENLERTGSFKRSFIGSAPHIAARLEQFRIRSEQTQGRFRDFLSIELQAAFLSRSLRKELHQVMYAQVRARKWDTGFIKPALDKQYEEYAAQIHTYIKAMRDTSQFRTYEKLFSWWHIFHIPLVYMLVLTGIYHVIAVHMY
ncbi:MAG: hypothetical protein HY306_08585 [Nitrosomonadales bacterium]|nr:hypothetical protein [Nitrosomonadales bacterium]